MSAWTFSSGMAVVLREERITQSDLARLLGVTPQWVSNRMHQRTRWSLLDATTAAERIGRDLIGIMVAGGYEHDDTVATTSAEGQHELDTWRFLPEEDWTPTSWTGVSW